MTRRKSVCLKWTLVLVLVVLCPCVYSRPQEAFVSSSTDSSANDVSTETNLRKSQELLHKTEKVQTTSTDENLSREVKTKTPLIGESMQVVASQLLQTPNNVSIKNVLSDTRVPPKIKNKIKTRKGDPDVIEEQSHIGEAVPVSMDELESENKLEKNKQESSTSLEGISTWILLSNTGTNTSAPTEPTKAEEPPKKKNNSTKSKTKKPQINKPSKRPIIGSTNKSDLVAGGSAINENVLNKIKDTVLTNVQKNKSTQTQKITTTTTATTEPTTEAFTTKISTSETPVTKITKSKKKNKNKIKTTSTAATVNNESALLPMEAKEQEIELEVSTPPTITKKPKRTSTKNKTKTKKRKITKPKPEGNSVNVIDVKTSNKTKSAKPSKKPAANNSSAISTQIYNYLSREVMPSVGVGMLGLASLVGIASYFFYPFSTPVRRTLDVDKKDDLYIHNAEEYANDGNGQAEEEMLGTVLAGMPANAKQKINPYAGQTVHINRYPAKKDQDLRYRHGAATGYTPNYNVRYPQQKTGIAHGVVYPEKVNYNPYTYETRHAQTTESKYAYEKGSSVTYTQAPSYPVAAEPIYAVPQTGPSGSSYNNDGTGSVVYGVKPSADSDFKPVYPYDSHFYAETTSSPITYAPTSMYLGSNKDEDSQDNQYADETSGSEEIDNKFVVGNVPKELSDTATPAVVPEHGPRLFIRKRRSIVKQEKGLYLDDLLKPLSKQNKYIIMSNEIDDLPPSKTHIKDLKFTAEVKDFPNPITTKTKIIESVSTAPIINSDSEKSTIGNLILNSIPSTTLKAKDDLKVIPYANLIDEKDIAVPTTTTETVIESNVETTSSEPKFQSTFSEITKLVETSTNKPHWTTKAPDLITYPPSNQESGIFSALKRLFEFKYKLGLSILQTTSDSLNRYLHDLDTKMKSSRTKSSSKKWF